MSPLRRLAGQTAIYGLSSIIGRVMNFLLTPLYTRVFLKEDYGIVTELYAYVAFLIVFLTYGMETAFFRFGSKCKSESERNKVFSTAFISVLTTAILFIALISASLESVASLMGYENNPEYILYFAWIIGLDAMVTIPLAKLRMANKPVNFAVVNLASVILNIGLNLFFILYCPYAMANPEVLGGEWVSQYYNPAIGIGYIFVANLASSILKFVLLLPAMIDLKFGFDFALWKRLMPYALPLLFLGLAGIVNETFDRAFFGDISGLPKIIADKELGVYGACYKVAMLLSIGIQAYRFAAEPFIFSMAADQNRDRSQATIMKFYFIVACFIALVILCFLDVALLLIGEEYREGKGVIPILLLAYIFFGAFFNLSFWYKLNDKTIYGAFIAAAGAVITVLTNLLLVPLYSYYGAAIATLLAYAAMAILSFILGQKKHAVPYDTKKILIILLAAIALYAPNFLLQLSGWSKYVLASISVISFAVFILISEKELLNKLKNVSSRNNK